MIDIDLKYKRHTLKDVKDDDALANKIGQHIISILKLQPIWVDDRDGTPMFDTVMGYKSPKGLARTLLTELLLNQVDIKEFD